MAITDQGGVQSRLAEQAMNRMRRGAESEQKLSSMPTLLDKTAAK